VQRQQRKEYQIETRERTLNFIKSSLDILVAVGLLKLAPRTITPRVTGALGFVTSAISCYQLLPTPQKAKSSWASSVPSAGRCPCSICYPWFSWSVCVISLSFWCTSSWYIDLPNQMLWLSFCLSYDIQGYFDLVNGTICANKHITVYHSGYLAGSCN
jgi:hypothetical protein